MQLLRRSELVLAVYFAYAAVVSLILPVRPDIRAVTVALNLAVLAGLALVAWTDSLRRRSLLGIVRDWYPMPLMLLAYREMGWFAQPHPNTDLERSWVVWDKLLLNDWGLRTAIEILGPVLPALLEIAYSLVYTMGPFSLAVLYACGRRARVDRFLFPFLLAVLGCYVLFPFFPSEPPRTVFPGEDLPSVQTVFRRFNAGLVGNWGIHTSVFPSAHVAGAFSAAFAMMRVLPENRWAGRLLVVMAVMIATATVYGRYHYLVDVLAGFAMSLVGIAASALADRKLLVR